MPAVTKRHPMMQIAQLVLAGLLALAGCVIAPLPGPGGIFFFAAALALVLRNSRWARGRFARAKRRWPRIGHALDLSMRRPSALRRRARTKAAREAAAPSR